MSREFKIIPDQGAVDATERDLRFHPSTVTEPATLTLENVAHFNKNGFVRPIRIFDGSEADDLRAYFNRLLEQAIAEGRDSYSISTAHLKYGRVYDLLTHPRIVACVQDLLGPDVVGWGSHFFCKMPGDGKRVAWHQDASYWPLTPSGSLTVWLAVDTAHFECYAFVTIACMYTLQPNGPPLGSEARGTLNAMEPPKTCQDQWLAWQTFPSLPRRPPLGSEGRDCLNILGHTKTRQDQWLAWPHSLSNAGRSIVIFTHLDLALVPAYVYQCSK